MNQTKEIDFEGLFKLFTDKKSVALGIPFKHDDTYFSTDGKILLYIKDSDIHLSFKSTEITPKAKYVIPDIFHEPVSVSIENLKKGIEEKTPLINDQRRCLTCDGDGEQECDLGHLHDCNDCGGRGYFKKHDKFIPDESVNFKLFDTAISRTYLLKLIYIADFLGHDVIYKVSEHDNKIVFTLGDLHVLFAAIYKGYEQYNKAIDLNPYLK